jgi:hypothetical protein
MNRLFAAIAVLFLSLGVFAQTPPLAPGTRTVGAGTSQLPAASSSGALNKVFNVTDSIDCVNAVAGTYKTPCISTGTVWAPWSLWKANRANLYYTAGKVGIGTLNPDQTLTVNGNASKVGGGSWASFSDERLKNIKGRFTSGLKAVMQLQPLRYEYKRDNALNLKSEGEPASARNRSRRSSPRR